MQREDSVPLRVDVCILCALFEEAEGIKTAFEEQLNLNFQRRRNARLRREYEYTTLLNNSGEPLNILVTWSPDTGPIATSLELKSLYEEFKPRFMAMTGICAGDKKKVKLGDIIVAERAFAYDTGKVVIGEDGRKEWLHDTHTLSPTAEVIQFAKGFTGWKAAVASEKRPSSKRRQRDWLLNKLLDPQTPRVDDISDQELAHNAPQWRQIVRSLQSGGDDRYLTSERGLEKRSKVYDLRYGEEVFPFKDPEEPSRYIAAIASGSAVRSDNPFKEISIPVRGTVAIDMEGASFYHTLSELQDVHYLLVKGVSDYADSEKDDSYHAYAAKVSALYMLSFLKEYVTSSRLPVRTQPPTIASAQVSTTSPSSTSTASTQTATLADQPNEFNIFYSYAPKDEALREELSKHLVLLKRQNLINQVYAHNIGVGRSSEEGTTERLQRSRLILLLLSPDFIWSDDLYEQELKPALELQKQGRVRVVPILLRPTDLEGTPLEKLVVLPRNQKPIIEWSSRDSAFVEVAREIRGVIKELRGQM